MSIRNDRIRRVARRLMVIYLFPAVLMIAAIISSLNGGPPVSDYVRDPASITGTSPMMGFFSNAGALLWASTAANCYLGWAVLRRRKEQPETASLFLWGAVLSTLLLIDDLFLLHEELLWTNIGFGEKQFYLLYLLIGGLGAWRYRKQIVQSEYLYLAAAIGLLGMSVLFDALRDPVVSWDHLIEEAPKWFGIVTWLVYWFNTIYRAM